MSRQVFALRQTRHHAHELMLPVWEGRSSLSAAQVPYTAGGTTYPVKRAAAIEAAHMEQSDRSFNPKLWSVSPAQYFAADRASRLRRLGELLPLVENYERAIETIHDAALTREVPVPKMTGEAFENLRLRRNAATLSMLTDTLDSLGFLEGPAAQDAETDPERLQWQIALHRRASDMGTEIPQLALRSNAVVAQRPGTAGKDVEFVYPDARAEAGGVPALERVVATVSQDKDAVLAKYAASGEYIRAAKELHRLLQNLYPWPASGLVFTPAQAFGTGIAQLESDLWAHTAKSLLHASRVTGYTRFRDAAMDCAEALTNMRYVTRGALSTAWFVFHEILGRKHKETSEPLMSYPSLMHVDAVVAKTSYLFGHALLNPPLPPLEGAETGHVHSAACGTEGHVHTDACGGDHGHHVHTDGCNHDHPEHVHTDACNHGHGEVATYARDEWAHALCANEHVCAEAGSEAAELIADQQGVFVCAPEGVDGEVELHGSYKMNNY